MPGTSIATSASTRAGTGVSRSASSTTSPVWMWRNTEVQEFADWLRQHNAKLPALSRAFVQRARSVQHGCFDEGCCRIPRTGRCFQRANPVYLSNCLLSPCISTHHGLVVSLSRLTPTSQRRPKSATGVSSPGRTPRRSTAGPRSHANSTKCGRGVVRMLSELLAHRIDRATLASRGRRVLFVDAERYCRSMFYAADDVSWSRQAGRASTCSPSRRAC